MQSNNNNNINSDNDKCLFAIKKAFIPLLFYIIFFLLIISFKQTYVYKYQY